MTFAMNAPHEAFGPYVKVLSTNRVTGEFCSKAIFVIPVTAGNPVDRAWNEAMNKISGTEALTDVSIDYKLAFLGVLYNEGCYRVSGIPVVFR